MPDLPTITLDTTLSDLYKEAGHDSEDKRLGHIFCGVTSALDLTPDFPRNLKYVYQEGAFSDTSDKDERYRQSMAVKFLSLVPQRDAFISGSAPVVFFHTSREEDKKAHDISETTKTLGVLLETQRPRPIYSAGPGCLQDIAKKHGLTRVSSKVLLDDVVDAADHPEGSVDCLIDSDVLWYLNSKEALARSGLPTPNARIVEVEQYLEDNVINTPGLDSFMNFNGFGPDRKTAWTKWLDEQVDTIAQAIREHPLPFVVKGNQSFAGAGTYVIQSEDDRKDLLKKLNGGLLKKLLSHITTSNEHLNLGTVMISDMVEDPVSNLGMTFFVTTDGEAIFLAASEQMIDEANSAWIGSTIVYSRQSQMKEKLSPLMGRIASWLHEHQYFGPVGADILETQDHELQIIDLNVRTSGSLCLPLMKTHFTSRGLDAASSFSITVKESREEFVEHFAKDFATGRMIIVAWYEENSLGESYGDVVVGAEDEGSLGIVIERVRSVSGTVTF